MALRAVPLRSKSLRLSPRLALACALPFLLTIDARADDIFGNRTDKPDGSAAVTVGRTLETDWETKVGVDVATAAADKPTVTSPQSLLSKPSNEQAGTAWAKVALPPSASQYGWDKASINARVDPLTDQGTLGTTFSRTVPVGKNVSITVENGLSVTDSLTVGTARLRELEASSSQVWSTDKSLRLNILATGTTLSAGTTTSSIDPQRHNTLSAEQQVFGPLSVTGAVNDVGTATSSKSVMGTFKRNW